MSTGAQPVSKLLVGPHVVLMGRYELVSEIARGGMGSVWRARHLKLGSTVAVKFALDGSPSGAERLFREAQAAAALGSPHIVQIIDFGQHEDTPFLVMEYLEGESLAERLRVRGALFEADALKLAREACRGLRVAHESGIVHRDIKPSNLFLVESDSDFILKLVDFGIARTRDSDLTGTREFLGTPRYASPEQVIERGTIDARSDLYSLALVLFECLTGRSPYLSKSATQVIREIGIVPLPVPSTLGLETKAFDLWFERATQLEPDDRYQTAEEFEAEFHRAFELSRLAAGGEKEVDRTVATVVAHKEERPIRRSRRGPVLMGIGALLLLGIAVLLGRAVIFEAEDQPTTTPSQRDPSPSLDRSSSEAEQHSMQEVAEQEETVPVQQQEESAESVPASAPQSAKPPNSQQKRTPQGSTPGASAPSSSSVWERRK